MDKQTLAWGVFGVYMLVTTGLAIAGWRKTKTLSSYALGNRDMGPYLVGVTLAAATASSATFIINPGFVYTSGVSALLHFGVAGMGGVIFGLVILSKGYRSLGTVHQALTLPHWLGARFKSPGLRTYMAIFNLAMAVAFVVLIIKGSALIMQHTLGMSYFASVMLIVVFVFGYIMIGGTYAHSYTNALQGVLMIGVALAIVASGLPLLADGIGPFMAKLAEQDPNLVKPLNPDSALFHSGWEVFGCGFIVSVGLVCQPHILIKSLYLKRDRDVNTYLIFSSCILVLFALILTAGLFARVAFPEIATQDAVMAVYINGSFSPTLGVFISVALLAAGMSTMDGILVSASSIAGNDLVLGALGQKIWPGRTQEAREQLALRASRWVLVAIGLGATMMALDPPRYVGIFAQVTIYGMVAAVLPLMLFGIYVRNVDRRDVLVASVAGPAVHYIHYFYVRYALDQPLQPAATAVEGTLLAIAYLGVMTWARTSFARSRSDGGLQTTHQG